MTDDEERALREIARIAKALVEETQDGWSQTARRIRSELQGALGAMPPSGVANEDK